MAKSIEQYIGDARANGVDDQKIKEMLVKAGWVPEQIEPILIATAENSRHPVSEQAGKTTEHKAHFSLRAIPDKITDIFFKIFK